MNYDNPQEDLRKLGFENVNMSVLTEVAQVHSGQMPLNESHIHPDAASMLNAFTSRVQQQTNTPVVAVPAGYTLLNWKIEEALVGTNMPFNSDIDAFSAFKVDSLDESDELGDVMVDVAEEVSQNSSVEFCDLFNPAYDRINLTDYNTSAFMEMVEGPDKVIQFARKKYRDLTRLSMLKPDEYGDEPEKFLEHLDVLGQELEAYYPDIARDLRSGDLTTGQSLRENIVMDPPDVISPIKPKHIKRLKPGVTDDQAVDVLNILGGMGIKVAYSDKA